MQSQIVATVADAPNAPNTPIAIQEFQHGSGLMREKQHGVLPSFHMCQRGDHMVPDDII